MINDDDDDDGEFDPCRCDEDPCVCFGCDCCEKCSGGYSCCGRLPEYNCIGFCEHRGEPGHYKVKPPGDPHPDQEYPERICSQRCCRPEEPARNVP
jgi:hypothetical protein